MEAELHKAIQQAKELTTITHSLLSTLKNVLTTTAYEVTKRKLENDLETVAQVIADAIDNSTSNSE